MHSFCKVSTESTKKRHTYDFDDHHPERGEEMGQKEAVDGETLTRAYKTVEEFVDRVDALNALLTKDAVTILQVQNGRGRDCDVVCAKLQALLQEGTKNAQVYQSRIEKLREVKEELRQEYLTELNHLYRTYHTSLESEKKRAHKEWSRVKEQIAASQDEKKAQGQMQTLIDLMPT